MVINSQHNSTDVASSLVAGVMGTLLALVLALDLALVLVLALAVALALALALVLALDLDLALAQGARKPIYLRLVVGRVQRSRKE